MVLLKAADAIHTEPARLARIDIKPASARLRPGESITLSASSLDQHGQPFVGAKVTWSATGGTIDQKGDSRPTRSGLSHRGPGRSPRGNRRGPGRDDAKRPDPLN